MFFVVIFTSEIMHGWISELVVIIKVMDHVLGFYATYTLAMMDLVV